MSHTCSHCAPVRASSQILEVWVPKVLLLYRAHVFHSLNPQLLMKYLLSIYCLKVETEICMSLHNPRPYLILGMTLVNHGWRLLTPLPTSSLQTVCYLKSLSRQEKEPGPFLKVLIYQATRSLSWQAFFQKEEHGQARGSGRNEITPFSLFQCGKTHKK